MLGLDKPKRSVKGFIPIGSRLSTETDSALQSGVGACELHPHRLAVEH